MTEDGAQRLSVTEFFALPLGRRIRMILDRKLSFFRGQQPVDVHLGLQSLMKVRRPE